MDMSLRTVIDRSLLLVFIGFASARSCSADVDARWITDDPRLLKTLHMSARQVRMGEILATMTASAGVNLTIDSRTAGSGVKLSVNFEDFRLIDFMNALTSLVSNRDGAWTWVRTTAAPYGYELSQSTRAKNRAARRREYATEAAVNNALTLIDLAGMTPEQRERNKRRLVDSQLLDTDVWADALIKDLGTWEQTRFLREYVPRESIAKLVRSETEVVIDPNALPARVKERYQHLWDQGTMTLTDMKNGVSMTIGSDPNYKIRLYTPPVDFTAATLAPVTFLKLPTPTGLPKGVTVGGASISVLGGSSLEEGIRLAIVKAWALPGDSYDSDLASRTVAKTTSLKTPEVEQFIRPDGRVSRIRIPRAMELRYLQMSQGARIPLLAIISRKNGLDPGEVGGRTVSDITTSIKRGADRPMVKWHSGAVLVNYAGWFMSDDKSIPFGIIKKYLSRQDRLIPLRDMAGLMSETTEDQIKELGEEYAAIREALPLRTLFMMAARRRELTDPQGMRVTPEAARELAEVQKLKECPGFLEGTVAALRLVQIDTQSDGRASIAIRVEVRRQGGEWESLGGFIQVPAAERVKKPM